MGALATAIDEAFESEQIPFLARLVDQPSCSREPDDVEAAARILDALAEDLGLSRRTVVDPSGAVASHRVYSHPSLADDRAEAVGLVGHIDTVFPRAMGFLRFTRDGNVARGPGVLDMKSGLSAIFFALRAIRAAAEEKWATLPVRVVVVSDEEIGSRNSAPLLKSLAPSLSAALVFECGRAQDAIVTSRKGVGSFELTAIGRSAHSGLHHRDGLNAIEALALAIAPISELTDYERGVTLNVGLIEGGTSANTVPPSATCTIDARYSQGADGPTLERELRSVVSSIVLPPHLAHARFELEGGFHRPPMEASDENRALMQAYAEEAKRLGLGSGEAPLQGGGSDANILSAAGVPTIDGLGPAGAGVHRTSEQCDLRSLRDRTVALARFLVR